MTTQNAAGAPAWDQVPWWRKQLGSGLIGLLFWPAYLIILWTGPIYYRKRGEVRRRSVWFKLFMSIGILLLAITLFGPLLEGIEDDPKHAQAFQRCTAEMLRTYRKDLRLEFIPLGAEKYGRTSSIERNATGYTLLIGIAWFETAFSLGRPILVTNNLCFAAERPGGGWKIDVQP